MPVALSDATKERIRSALGYLSVDRAASISLGFPSATQAQFLVESAMERVMPEAVGRIEKILSILEDIECMSVDAMKDFKIQQVGDIKFRNTNEEKNACDLLDDRYTHWAMRLAEILGVPANVYAHRFGGASGGINTRVVHDF